MKPKKITIFIVNLLHNVTPLFLMHAQISNAFQTLEEFFFYVTTKLMQLHPYFHNLQLWHQQMKAKTLKEKNILDVSINNNNSKSQQHIGFALFNSVMGYDVHNYVDVNFL